MHAALRKNRGARRTGNFFEGGGVRIHMDAEKIRQLIAVPFAALFLVLAFAVFAARRQASAGVPLRVYSIPPDPPRDGVCNFRELVVSLDEKGTVRINENETPISELRPRLAEIFENRYLKQVFVVADSSVSYQQFAEFFSQIHGASPGLEVMLFSGDFRRAQEQRAVIPCVFLPEMLKVLQEGH